MFDDILPIEIRPGMFVRIAPLPYDLTKAEAEKIARVVMAMVLPLTTALNEENVDG